MTATSMCHLCPDEPPFTTAGAILHHLRVCHPSVWEGIDRWPDGSIVWHDSNPTPEEASGEVA